MKSCQLFSLLLCGAALPVTGEQAPPRIVRNVFHSTFDSQDLGRSPGAVVTSTFDTDKIDSFNGDLVFASEFETPSLPSAPAVVTTSFEDGISPEIFQWNQESPFKWTEGGRTGTHGVRIKAANMDLRTHDLPASPDANYELSVWFKGEGKVRARAFDGARWLESASAGGKQDDWSLIAINFKAQPPPAPKKGAKIIELPRPKLAASIGMSGNGSLLFDDFRIVRLNTGELTDAEKNSGAVWNAHQTEFGDGLAGTRAIRIRNGNALDSKAIPVEPGKEYLLRFYFNGLSSKPTIPERVLYSACVGRVTIDAVTEKIGQRYWGHPTNLLIEKLGTPDQSWRRITIPISVPAKLWNETPTGIVIRFASAISTSAGFDYHQTGDVLIDSLSLVELRREINGKAGDEFWQLYRPEVASGLGSHREVALAAGVGLAKSHAIHLRPGGHLVSFPLSVMPGEIVDISWYYKGLKSEANRPEFSKGTFGCGRLLTTYLYDEGGRRDTGHWMPMTLSDPEKPDTEWKYVRLQHPITTDVRSGKPTRLSIQVLPDLRVGLQTRGEMLLDNFVIRRTSGAVGRGPFDSWWLGVPDTTYSSEATGNDSSLQVLSRAGVRRSRAVQLSGIHRIETLPIPVEASKRYQLSFQYKVAAPAVPVRNNPNAGQVEMYWHDTGILNERANITYLKPEKSEQPDAEWRSQHVQISVPAELRNKAKPSSVSIVLGSISSILFDDIRLDELEDASK